MKGLFSLSGVQLDSFQIIDDHVFILAHSKHNDARCPYCNKKSKRVHSSYVRVLRDLPLSTYCVSINLTVRKFFCHNPKCKRKIFTEQPSHEVKAYSRMTNRSRLLLQNIFLEVSAMKGSYISGLISLPTSPSTALRLVDSLPIPPIDKVNVLGVDDWAYRKGISYGTILVNIETGRVIDLLEDRDGRLLKGWLAQHPEVKIVTRDRASAYSCAVSEMLPDAIQVADRFHLLKNLSDSVYDVIRLEYRNLIKSVNEEDSSYDNKILLPDVSNKASQKEKGEMNDYLKSRFSKVKEMQKKGHSKRAIARSLRMSTHTVNRYSQMDVLPKKSIYLKNNYSEYQKMIENEFSQGQCLTEVYRTIKKAGFKGCLSAFSLQFKDHPMRPTFINGTTPVVKQQIISPRKISRYMRFADLSEIGNKVDREIMTSLISRNSLLKKLRQQVLSFKTLLLGNEDSLLEPWIRRTLDIGKFQLKTFVGGLRKDIDAVRNAIKTNWSNGQVEGQVNRLKSIKRQMYGRAGFDLLRKKLVLGTAG